MIYLPIIVFGAYLVLFLHELGHAFLYLPFTKGSVSVLIGSLNSNDTQFKLGRLRLGINMKSHFLCGRVQLSDCDVSRVGVIVGSIGGPLVSLLVFIALYRMIIAGTISAYGNEVVSAFTFLMYCALYQFVFTIIPMRYLVGSYKGMRSDGMRIVYAIARK